MTTIFGSRIDGSTRRSPRLFPRVRRLASFARFVRRAVDEGNHAAERDPVGGRDSASGGPPCFAGWPATAGLRSRHGARLLAGHRAIPVTAALAAAGLRDGEQHSEDPAVEADLRVIPSRLADPETPEAEKTVIREMLHFLAIAWSATPTPTPAQRRLSA